MGTTHITSSPVPEAIAYIQKEVQEKENMSFAILVK